MGFNSASSPFAVFGKVVPVRRKRAVSLKDEDSSITALVSRSLPMLKIGAGHITPVTTESDLAIAAGDASHDETPCRRLQEYATVGLTVAFPIADAIPVAGGALKAAIGGLLEILKALNQTTQNQEDMKSLSLRLRRLNNHMFAVPEVGSPINELRKNLTEQLNGTLTTLRTVEDSPKLRYSSAAQKIKQCSTDIDHYLQEYSVWSNMHLEHAVQQIATRLDVFVTPVVRSTAAVMTGLVLVDATGRRYEMPMYLATSFEQFTKAMGVLFATDKLEARVQRRYMEMGRYDLCIDAGAHMVPIEDELHWLAVERGTTIVMRVVLVQEQTSSNPRYQCPRCKTWNAHGHGPDVSGSSVDCQGCEGRFQISEADKEEDVASQEDDDKEAISAGLAFLSNFHLKQFPVRTPPQWLTAQMQIMQGRYPNDQFEITLRHISTATVVWRIQCLDCPGKLYAPGPLETLSNYEVHLRNRQHRQRVNDRLAGVAAPAANAANT